MILRNKNRGLQFSLEPLAHNFFFVSFLEFLYLGALGALSTTSFPVTHARLKIGIISNFRNVEVDLLPGEFFRV